MTGHYKWRILPLSITDSCLVIIRTRARSSFQNFSNTRRKPQKATTQTLMLPSTKYSARIQNFCFGIIILLVSI